MAGGWAGNQAGDIASAATQGSAKGGAACCCQDTQGNAAWAGQQGPVTIRVPHDTQARHPGTTQRAVRSASCTYPELRSALSRLAHSFCAGCSPTAFAKLRGT